MTMHTCPSSLQQPSMRHARWQVAEANCSVCISSRKVAAAANGTELVCNFLTATCMSSDLAAEQQDTDLEEAEGIQAHPSTPLLRAFPAADLRGERLPQASLLPKQLLMSSWMIEH